MACGGHRVVRLRRRRDGGGGAASLAWSLAWGAGDPLPHEFRDARRPHHSVRRQRDRQQEGPGVLEVVREADGEWAEWRRRVPQTEVPTAKAAASDVVVPTLDTVRHAAVIGAWLRQRRPLLLCGPPGCGKTLTLAHLIGASSSYELLELSFSSATSPSALLGAIASRCELTSSARGLTLSPRTAGWLVVFIDEVNLPRADRFGTSPCSPSSVHSSSVTATGASCRAPTAAPRLVGAAEPRPIRDGVQSADRRRRPAPAPAPPRRPATRGPRPTPPSAVRRPARAVLRPHPPLRPYADAR